MAIKFLKRAHIEELNGLSTSTSRDRVKARSFPKPVKIRDHPLSVKAQFAYVCKGF